jgi:glycosyltransferase involved in cell wall biosynthesis
MNLVIATDQRYEATPDGKVWTPGQFAHQYWRRYLEVFSLVRVVARVRQVAAVPPGWTRADGPGVSFAPVTYYLGPWQYLLRRHRVRAEARDVVGPSDAVIFRGWPEVAACLVPLLRRASHPYGLEVIGDPYDVFAPGACRHPLRPFFRWWSTRNLRRQCAAGACGALYMTEQALQRRYPCPAYSVGVTDVELPESAIALRTRSVDRRVRTVELITVATLEQLYKSPDVLIDAVAACTRDGLDLRLTMDGGGKERPGLEARALGLGPRVRFLGQLPAGEAVRAELDRADLFVLPSRQEGLPRAMIEAMARALPCIGSTVGGIPELLPPEDMVPPGNAEALAAKIREVVTDPGRMARMSTRNLEKAREYREDALRERRVAFYQYIKNQTELWIARRCESLGSSNE